MADDQLLALDEALVKLARVNPEGGGRHLGFSRPTAKRLWAFVRAWLFREIKKELSLTG